MSKILQIVHKGYSEISKTAALTPASAEQLRVYNVKLHNRSGGAIDVGALRKFTQYGFKVFSQTAPGVCTNVSDLISAGTNSTVIGTVNNNGMVVQSKDLFNLLGLTVSQAQTGAPVYAYQYYNGTSFVTLNTIAVPASYALGSQVIIFNAPQDWVKGSTGLTGLDSGKYTMRVLSTTAPGTAVQASALWAGQLLDFQEGVADNASLEMSFPDNLPLTFEGNEGLLPYFSSASAQNQVRIVYESKD